MSGGTYVGIAGGEIYGSEDWINVNVSGMVGTPGPETGSIVGRKPVLISETAMQRLCIKRKTEDLEVSGIFRTDIS